MESILTFFKQYIIWRLPSFGFIDAIELIIMSIAIFYLQKWLRQTRGYVVIKGIFFLLIFMGIAYSAQMTTITFLLERMLNVGIIALLIIFQPELRRVLEQLGKRNVLSNLLTFDTDKGARAERFSNHTIEAIVRATFELGRNKTGALIVIEQDDVLTEYENTGIILDSEISYQLLVQIFEHNTPLHDGAVIIRGDRIRAATCYLPLSSNMDISKDLGTRHRAGIGISESTDSFTIIASEETGKISLAIGGKLIHDIDTDSLRDRLTALQKKNSEIRAFERFRMWKQKGGAESHE